MIYLAFFFSFRRLNILRHKIMICLLLNTGMVCVSLRILSVFNYIKFMCKIYLLNLKNKLINVSVF
jgi:hypothetical protein